jgi:starch synthase
MNVLFVVAEMAPFAKTGGLADVAAALPAALQRMHVDVRVVMPLYRGISRDRLSLERATHASLASQDVYGALWRGAHPNGTPIYFVDAPQLFDRAGIYGEDGGAYGDNLLRFTFLCQCAVQLAQLTWKPDVVHCHDWHAALVPAYLRVSGSTPTLFTIHNLAHQGRFPADQFPVLGLEPGWFNMHGVEYYGDINVMKAGLVSAHVLNTVSETYAREVQTPEFGYGLDGVMRERAGDLFGVLNGVDYSEWDPRVDRHIAARFSADDLSGKARCKSALQQELGLPTNAYTPLIGCVARIAEQKGFDILVPSLSAIVDAGAQIVVLGVGDPALERALQGAAARWPNHVRALIGFDEAWAHRIEAGADFFLMPSRFEPSGLNQLYSLRYGTIPIVRRTGGLADSVVDATAETVHHGVATGFVFDDYTPDALISTVGRAIFAYRDPVLWRSLQSAAMRADFSWDRAAVQYRTLYGLAGERAGRNR